MSCLYPGISGLCSSPLVLLEIDFGDYWVLAEVWASLQCRLLQLLCNLNAFFKV